MFGNCDDAQQVTMENLRFVSGSNEEVCSIPNQSQIIRYLVGHGRQMQVSSEQREVKEPREDTDSDHAECVHTREGTITVGSWLQSTLSFECERVRILRRSQR